MRLFEAAGPTCGLYCFCSHLIGHSSVMWPKPTGQKLGDVHTQAHVCLVSRPLCICSVISVSVKLAVSFPIATNFSHHNKVYPITMRVFSEEQVGNHLQIQSSSWKPEVLCAILTPVPMVDISNQLTRVSPRCSLRIPQRNAPEAISNRIMLTYLPSQTWDQVVQWKTCFFSFQVLLTTHHWHFGRVFSSWDGQNFGTIKEAQRPACHYN